MKIISYRTTMPFTGGLSPPTEKSRVSPWWGGGPFDQPRQDFDRNTGGDHKFIDTDNTDGKSHAIMNGLFEGEGKSVFLVDADVYYLVEKLDGETMVVEDLSFAQIIVKYPGCKVILKHRRISNAATGGGTPNFMSLVSNLLISTFKVESDSEKYGKREIGSCFCVAPNGFLTCAHVVSRHREDPSGVVVEIIEGDDRHRAVVEDIDYDMDLAFLSCDTVRSHPISIKTAAEVPIGKEIVCIGSPYGYDNDVSTGILSSKDRVVDRDSNVSFIFMDLSLYPGSSGGPVVDVDDGRAIGIAAVIVQSVGNYGLNAAIPIEYAVERFGDLL